MPKLLLDDAEIFYEVRGTGKPLVLIPGFASGAWSWAWQIDEFSTDFKTISFDPRGIAESRLIGVGAVSIQHIAEDVANLLDHLEIEKTSIFGISFGGFVAQNFAIRFPNRVDKLVLASTSFGGTRHVAPASAVYDSFSAAKTIDSNERMRRNIRMAFTPEFAMNNEAEIERFCQMRESSFVPATVYQQQLNSAIGFASEPDLGSIRAETLVLTGDNDLVVPAENSANLVRSLQNATLAIIEGGGHMAFVEEPKKFNSIVREFLLK